MEANCGAILVGDEDEAFRARLCRLLEDEGYTTVQAAAGEDVLAQASEQRPAMVVLDVQLPGISGYDVCRQLRKRFGERLPIIFVSATRTEAMDRVAGLLVGADDYIVEPYAPDELVARVWRALTRVAALDLSADAAVFARLTPREQEILGLLADGRSPKAIATELFISRKTVETHVQHVLVKLDVHSRAEAVARAFQLGLLRPGVEAHAFEPSVWE